MFTANGGILDTVYAHHLFELSVIHVSYARLYSPTRRIARLSQGIGPLLAVISLGNNLPGMVAGGENARTQFLLPRIAPREQHQKVLRLGVTEIHKREPVTSSGVPLENQSSPSLRGDHIKNSESPSL